MTGSFWDHIEELRRRLLTSIAIILLGTFVAFSFYPTLHTLLTYPLKTHFSLFEESVERTSIQKFLFKNRTNLPQTITLPNQELTLAPREERVVEVLESVSPLVILGPLEGMIASMKASFWCSLIVTSPLWGAQILLFILPALQKRERRLILPFLFFSFVFLFLAISIAIAYVIPLANQILSLFNFDLGMPLYSITNYLGFTLLMTFATVVTFQAGLILFLLIGAGVLEAERLIQARRFVIVGIFIVSALVTPPDVPTQLMMALPLTLLYECGIIFAKCRKREDRSHKMEDRSQKSEELRKNNNKRPMNDQLRIRDG